MEVYKSYLAADSTRLDSLFSLSKAFQDSNNNIALTLSHRLTMTFNVNASNRSGWNLVAAGQWVASKDSTS